MWEWGSAGSRNILFLKKTPFSAKGKPGRKEKAPPLSRPGAVTVWRGVEQQAATPPSSRPPSYHGDALRVAVEVRGGAAAAGRLAPPAARVLQRGHHGVVGDGPKLVGEGAVEDQDVDDEDPLADGGQVLQEEALVHEEDAAWGRRVKEKQEPGCLRKGMGQADGGKPHPRL